MSRVHMLSSETPISFSKEEGCLALCGKYVPNAKSIYDLNLETGEMSPSTSSIVFCKECLVRALTPIGARRIYVYGIAPAQSAHDSRFTQADGYSE